MFLAAKHGNLEIVEILQTHGASSDQRVTETNSPLYQALINGHSHVAKVLISEPKN